MKQYSILERKVLEQFHEGQEVNINSHMYKVLASGKPRVSQGGGEPKTDCYILLEDVKSKQKIEYKISCKLKDANEFQENKISDARAEEILGPNWSEIITKTAKKLDKEFLKISLHNPNGRGRVHDGHVILGWKLEIANKKRTLSAELVMSDDQIRDYIYKGKNQSSRKINAKVNGQEIKESGIPEYILVSTPELINSAQDVINSIQSIDTYAIDPHYLIFTSNSYRVLKNKTDGNRYLAVRVEWSIDTKNGLTYELKYDNPLVPPSRSLDMKKRFDSYLNKFPQFRNEFKNKYDGQ